MLPPISVKQNFQKYVTYEDETLRNMTDFMYGIVEYNNHSFNRYRKFLK